MKWYYEVTKKFDRKGDAQMMGDMLANWAGMPNKFLVDKAAPRKWEATVLVPDTAVEDGTVERIFGKQYGIRVVAIVGAS